MKNSAKSTLLDNSHAIAGWSNVNEVFSTSLYHYSVTLYRHKGGRYFVRQTGGTAMAAKGEIRWLSEPEARDFIRDYASHPISGYGFTESEINELINGGDPRGTADNPSKRPPDFWSL